MSQQASHSVRECRWPYEWARNSTLSYAERPRELGDFKEVGQFEAEFLVILLYTFRANISLWTVRNGNGYTTTLPLEFFTQKLCSRLYSIAS